RGRCSCSGRHRRSAFRDPGPGRGAACRTWFRNGWRGRLKSRQVEMGIDSFELGDGPLKLGLKFRHIGAEFAGRNVLSLSLQFFPTFEQVEQALVARHWP